MKTIKIGQAANDGTGTTAREAGAALNYNVLVAQGLAGMAGRELCAQAGDSMMGNAAASGWSALFAALRMLHYDFNAIIDQRRYYDAESPTNERLPIAQRGLNFGKGGTPTEHMLEVQLPYILEALDAGMTFRTIFVSPLQNDRFASLAAAKASVARVLTFVDTLIARGIDVIMLGVWPHNLLVDNGTANAYGKHYCERALTMAMATRPGFHYVPILALLKENDPTQEADGKVNWKLAKGVSGGGSLDDIHAGPSGARDAAPALVPIMKRRFREFTPPTFDGLEFDQTKNPLGNIFGAAGLFYGSGGLLNGVASANVPQGVQTVYTTGEGVTFTPSLTGDPEYPYRLTLGGVATTAQRVLLAIISRVKAVNPGLPVEVYGKLRLVNVRGIAGIGCGQIDNFDPITVPITCGIGSVGGAAHVIPRALNEVVTLHSMQPGYFRKEYEGGSIARLAISTATVAGVEISGAIEFSRLGLFGIDPDNA